jgi:hypothetical protein
MTSSSYVDEDHCVVALAVSIFRAKNIISLQIALFPNEVPLYKNK